MGAGKTIAGVILLAIGLPMVISGGAIVIDSFLNPSYNQPYSSNGMIWIIGVISFWIGMVPTIFGIRFVAQPGTIREIEDRIDILTKHSEENITKKHDFQKQLDAIRNDLEEEIKKQQIKLN